LADFATAAGLQEKIAAMRAGVHINSTENRAVLHVALRAPKDASYVVDGEDAVPGIHAVLEKVTTSLSLGLYRHSLLIADNFVDGTFVGRLPTSLSVCAPAPG